MQSATLNLRVAPRRMLGRHEAAIYCGMTATLFKANCPCRPVALPGGATAWDVRDLDKWLDGLKGSDVDGSDATIDDIVDKLA